MQVERIGGTVMNDLLNVGAKETITSLELVDQINYFRNAIEGKKELRHYDLLKIVRNEFEEEIGDGKISESYYINSQNKKQPMFNLTLSQAKQVLVRESRAVRKAVIKYIETLEEKLKENSLTLTNASPEIRAILTMDRRVTQTQEKVEQNAKEFKEFKDNAPLFNIECEEITKAVRKKAVQHLGGYKSPAYNNKSLRSRVFRDIHTQVKREYDLDSYKAIKRKNLEEAIGIIENHTLPKALMEEVYMYNRQITGF